MGDMVKAGTRVFLSDGYYDVTMILAQAVEDWDGNWVGIDDDSGKMTCVYGHMCSTIIVGDKEIITEFGCQP